jgi:hypothetical protein
MDNHHEPIAAYLKAAHDPLQMGGGLQLPPGFGKTANWLVTDSRLVIMLEATTLLPELRVSEILTSRLGAPDTSVNTSQLQNSSTPEA